MICDTISFAGDAANGLAQAAVPRPAAKKAQKKRMFSQNSASFFFFSPLPPSSATKIENLFFSRKFDTFLHTSHV
ncbi:hypothetical protein DW741_04540 [Ruminococcaceae bacterium AM28-23LB]|nr:hypothetical protein DW741_04540 [Ruminococcaceae bacterium AM28-23LB]